MKQCDENCDDTCDNSRIYISNLPPDVTIDELRDLFGGIGQVESAFLLLIYSFTLILSSLLALLKGIKF